MNQSIIEIPGIIPGLNGGDGLMRAHWSTIEKQKTRYCNIILFYLSEKKAQKHPGPVSIEYVGYKSLLMDWDNFCASFKHLGDSLVKMKIITNDSPEIVQNFLPKQIKCKREEQKVIIKITDI